MVVFPFEPVMASIFALQKAGGQFQLANDREAQVRTCTSSGVYKGTPGLRPRSGPGGERWQPMTAGFDNHAGFQQRGNLFAQRLGVRKSETVTCAPRRRRKSAAAKPEIPNPTTRTFLPLSSTRESLSEIRGRLQVFSGKAGRIQIRGERVMRRKVR